MRKKILITKFIAFFLILLCSQIPSLKGNTPTPTENSHYFYVVLDRLKRVPEEFGIRNLFPKSIYDGYFDPQNPIKTTNPFEINQMFNRIQEPSDNMDLITLLNNLSRLLLLRACTDRISKMSYTNQILLANAYPIEIILEKITTKIQETLWQIKNRIIQKIQKRTISPEHPDLKAYIYAFFQKYENHTAPRDENIIPHMRLINCIIKAIEKTRSDKETLFLLLSMIPSLEFLAKEGKNKQKTASKKPEKSCQNEEQEAIWGAQFLALQIIGSFYFLFQNEDIPYDLEKEIETMQSYFLTKFAFPQAPFQETTREHPDDLIQTLHQFINSLLILDDSSDSYERTIIEINRALNRIHSEIDLIVAKQRMPRFSILNFFRRGTEYKKDLLLKLVAMRRVTYSGPIDEISQAAQISFAPRPHIKLVEEIFYLFLRSKKEMRLYFLISFIHPLEFIKETLRVKLANLEKKKNEKVLSSSSQRDFIQEFMKILTYLSGKLHQTDPTEIKDLKELKERTETPEFIQNSIDHILRLFNRIENKQIILNEINEILTKYEKLLLAHDKHIRPLLENL